MRLEYSVNLPPKISVRSNIWITVPIGALIVAILTANFLLLNYVHVFTSMLWTGTDIFMAFLLGPILRGVSLSTRKDFSSKYSEYAPLIDDIINSFKLVQSQTGALNTWMSQYIISTNESVAKFTIDIPTLVYR